MEAAVDDGAGSDDHSTGAARRSSRNFGKIGSRITLSEILPQTQQKQKPKSKAERNRDYLINVLADSERASSYREKNRLRAKLVRASATDEQREKSNVQARIRMAKMRKNKKVTANESAKRKTRKSVEEQFSLRQKWRQDKQNYRQNITPSKKAWINRKRRENRQKLKEENEAAVKKSTQLSQTTQTELVENRTACAKRKALSLARKGMPNNPKQYAETLKQLHDTASPRKRSAMLESFRQFSGSREVETTVGEAMEAVKSKTDLKSRQVRKVLLHVFSKYGSISKRSRILKMNRKTVSSYDENINLNNMGSLNNRSVNSEKLQSDISTVFQSKSTSLPDKKLVSKKTGLPKSVLRLPLKEVYNQYKDDGGKGSFSTFAKCRPSHIRKMAATNFNQCLCEYCANCDLKIKAINKIAGNHNKIKHVYHAVKLSKYHNGGKSCAYRKCADCDITKLEDYLADVAVYPNEVKWYRWTDKKIQYGDRAPVSRKVLETRNGTVQVLLREFLQEIAFLSEHLYRADWQHKQFETIRKKPGDYVIMVLDFAENYTCQYQNEVQSAHWHHEQVTLHPISTYFSCPSCSDTVYESLIYVSDDICHDYHAVNTFVGRTVTYLKDQNVKMAKIIEWTDGCAAQYKSKGPFCDISFSVRDHGVPIERNYFGSRHGKGPCDGEAAVVKQSVTRAVRSGNAMVTNAKELYEFCVGSSLTKTKPGNESC